MDHEIREAHPGRIDQSWAVSSTRLKPKSPSKNTPSETANKALTQKSREDSAKRKAETAASAMGITAQKLSKLGLVADVLEEPLGGAHRDPEAMGEVIKNALVSHIDSLTGLSHEQLLQSRDSRISAFGRFEEA